MTIGIVAPQYKAPGEFYELPLGLAYISSYLKARGQNPTFINMNEGQTIETTGSDPMRGKIFSVSVLCPHCQTKVKYNNLYWCGSAIHFNGGKSYRIGCRNCNQRIDISPGVFK